MLSRQRNLISSYLVNRWTVIAFLILSGYVFAQVESDCTYKGIKLYGRVRVVDTFNRADLKVRFVKSYADIRVRLVDSFANSCGRWRYVDSFEDFTIIIVDSFEDVRVKIVNSFEGVE